MSVSHGWLGDGAVLASMHLPDAGGASVGVVLCPPIGQEYITTYRGLRLVAERLASAGLAAIRFDYPGFGDSTVAATGSSFDDGPRLAADSLRALGVDRILYLGLASGALIAAEAAAHDPNAAGLVLWDAPASGRKWLRRARSLYTLAVGESDAGSAGTIAGAELDIDLIVRLNSLTIANSLERGQQIDESGSRRTLLAVRPAAADTSEQGATSIERLIVDDTHLMLDTSSINARIAARSIDAILAWIVDAFPSSPTASAAEAHGETSVLFIAEDSALIEERIVAIGSHELFGIETAPALRLGSFPKSAAPAVVLLNGSSEHRIGATRYQVELARTLAAKGMRVLRFDRRGTGESGRVTADEPNLLFTREWLDDGAAGVAHLGLPRDSVGVIGMCVGAWIGMMLEPEISRFIVAISPNDYRTSPASPNAIAMAESAANGGEPSWRRRMVELVKKRLPYPALLIAARRGQVQLPEVVLRPALAGGTDIVIFAGPGDAALFDRRHGQRAEARLVSEPGELRVIRHPTGDHSLFAPSIRQAAIKEAVETTLASFADLLSTVQDVAEPRHRTARARRKPQAKAIATSAQDAPHHRGGPLAGVGIGRLVGDAHEPVGAEVDSGGELEGSAQPIQGSEAQGR